MAASLAHDAAGPGREAILQQRPWGFEPRAITAPVALWHSRNDEDVPFGTAEIIAQRIPTATLHVQDEAGHEPSPASAQAAIQFLLKG